MALHLFKQRSGKPIELDKANANDFRGEWLALVDNKIVAHHRELSNVMGLTRGKHRGSEPRYVRVPLSNVAMY